ncbi:hypothetical protein ACFWPQ_01890 [Streptomyces sp. NPDC058464]|uniref:hypothetical protein n=1 Tax=Streptomyces sp. NPDC058464 TaxID=3346511 RepID=UPI0036595BC1
MGRVIYAEFPQGHPRGSWPAEEEAARLVADGIPATVVARIDTDQLLVVSPAEEQS